MARPAAPVSAEAPGQSELFAERPGQIIGRYKLLEEIGQGGFGVVYMAEQEEPVRRKVAFKIIKPGMDTRAVIARFEAERQALALMEYPNIARVFDAGTTDSGRPYFVMELVKGVPITAARFYAEAFAAKPKLADVLEVSNRYNAACAAALAGCGQGQDAAALDDAERARLRRQALDWLRADLAAWGQLLQKQPEQAPARVQQTLRDWQQDQDFAGVRGDVLANLPEAERQGWRQLWADVEQTLKKAEDKDTDEAKRKSPN